MTTDKPTCCEKCAGVPYSGQSFKDIPTRLSCIVCPCHKPTEPNWKSSKEDVPYSNSETRDWAKEKPTEPEKWHCTRCNADWVNDGRWPHLCKPTEPSVCGVAEYDTEGAPFICQNSKPCPLHEPSEVKLEEVVVAVEALKKNRFDPYIAQQEEASVEALAEEELRHPITVLMFALHKILGDENWNEKVAPLLRESKTGVDDLIAQAEKRGENRGRLEGLGEAVDELTRLMYKPLKAKTDI